IWQDDRSDAMSVPGLRREDFPRPGPAHLPQHRLRRPGASLGRDPRARVRARAGAGRNHRHGRRHRDRRRNLTAPAVVSAWVLVAWGWAFLPHRARLSEWRLPYQDGGSVNFEITAPAPIGADTV